MKRICRLLAGGLTLALVFLCCAGAAAAQGFTDVGVDAWYREAVTQCAAEGWLTGTGETEFAPEGEVSLLDVLLALYRFAGAPVVDAPAADVPADYAAAVAWSL